MKTYAHRTGAVCYALWGILHIVGASVLLLQLASGSTADALATIGSATPAAALPTPSDGLTAAVLGYYAWNLLWIGGFVLVVAIRLNWQNSAMGYWLNLTVVSAVDLGLVVALVAPGHMALADGLLGVALWLPATFFSTVGLVVHNVHAAGRITIA